MIKHLDWRGFAHAMKKADKPQKMPAPKQNGNVITGSIFNLSSPQGRLLKAFCEHCEQRIIDGKSE